MGGLLAMSLLQPRLPQGAAAPQPAAAAAAHGGPGRLGFGACPGRPFKWSKLKHDSYAADAVIHPCGGKTKKCQVDGCLYCVRHCLEHSDDERKRIRDETSPLGLRDVVPKRRSAAAGQELTLNIVSPAAASATEASWNEMMTYNAGVQDDDRPLCPLTDRNAALEDIARCFDMDEKGAASYCHHGRAGGKTSHDELTEEAKQRRYNALNTPVSVLADIIEPINPKELLSQWHLHEALLCTEDEESVLCDNAISLLQAVRTSTEAGQLLSALLCKTASQIQGGVAKLKKMTGTHSIRNSRYFADLFDQICKDGKVPIKRHTRVRTKPKVVPALVRWILSDENVQTVSWTKKKAYTDNKKIEDIPCLSRKRSKEAMWRSYCRAFPDASKRVQHTSFMRVTRALTGKQQRAVQAVDYLKVELVYSNRDRLERLVREVVDVSLRKRIIITEMREVFSYATSAFATKIGSVDCPSLDMKFALHAHGLADTLRRPRTSLAGWTAEVAERLGDQACTRAHEGRELLPRGVRAGGAGAVRAGGGEAGVQVLRSPDARRDVAALPEQVRHAVDW